MSPTSQMYLVPLVVQVADDRIGFVHELLSFVVGRREQAEGGAVPVPLDAGWNVFSHDGWVGNVSDDFPLKS